MKTGKRTSSSPESLTALSTTSVVLKITTPGREHNASKF